MDLQPGKGYNFVSSPNGVTMDTSNPFPDPDGPSKSYQQFECKVESETTAGTTKFYLKTRKGVVNYTWSGFPFRPEPTYPGEYPYIIYEKQARINDWAVYQNGKRTAGTATDGDAFGWMADDGKIELPTGASGASVLVLMSKIDWWDRDGWHSARRLVDAEMPFVSVISTSDTVAMGTLVSQQGNSLIHGGTVYFVSSPSFGFSFDPPYPLTIGYTYKKIAQVDWNDTTNQWDVTQYEFGPMNIRVHAVTGTMFQDSGSAPTPTNYDDALASEFNNCVNHAWFEGTWAIPSYTLNSANWWTHLVNT
jgi:hypothetical protein